MTNRQVEAFQGSGGDMSFAAVNFIVSGLNQFARRATEEGIFARGGTTRPCDKRTPQIVSDSRELDILQVVYGVVSLACD